MEVYTFFLTLPDPFVEEIFIRTVALQWESRIPQVKSLGKGGYSIKAKSILV